MGHEYVKEGDTFSTSRNGTVPKPTAQEVSDGKVLGANGQWVAGGGGGGGDSVSYSQTLQSGTECGKITINSTTTPIYAPTPPSVVNTNFPNNTSTTEDNGIKCYKYGNICSISGRIKIKVSQTAGSGILLGTITSEYYPSALLKTMATISDQHYTNGDICYLVIDNTNGNVTIQPRTSSTNSRWVYFCVTYIIT